jgi:hypothetical protein
MKIFDKTAGATAHPSSHPTPIPRFDFGKFAKESGACTLVPAGESLRTAQSLEKMLAEVEEGWEEAPASRSGTRLARTAVLEVNLDTAVEELSHRERFVMMHVDGASSVAALIDLIETVGIDREACCEIIDSLVQRGFVRVCRCSSGIRVSTP